MLLAGAGPAPAVPGATLDISIANLRSDRGLIQLCLTRDPAHFPDCEGDPTARRLTAPAHAAGHIALPGVPAGDYALSVIHDENANGRLDTRFGIPSEGVGFSRNPRLMFGPPSFAAARFALASGSADQKVTVKYFL